MTAPGRKPRWSAEKRAIKGKNPQRPRGQRDADAPLNRKQRRALQFGDNPAPRTEREEPRAERTFGERPARRNEGDDRRPRRFEDRGERRFQDRDERRPRRFDDRDDRRGGRFDDRRPSRFNDRDDRFRGSDDRRARSGEGRGYQGRSEGNSRFEGRSSRFEGRSSSFEGRSQFEGRDRRSFEGRDDRRGGRFDDRRPSRFNDRDERRDGDGFRSQRRFDDRPRGPRSFEDRDDRRGGRFEGRPQRGFAGKRDNADRPWRQEDRRPERRDNDSEESNSDQMSWSAGAAEVFEGELQSGFLELGVAEPMVRALAAQGITAPFPIQAATIGDALAGRDVLGRGRTGSGKTLAFGLPMLTRLTEGNPIGAPRAMVLTPTRELALQIADVLSPLASTVGLHLTLVAGGMSYGPQIKAFERGVDVVVATPGRLIDLVEQGAVDLSQIQITVLDEADHMADMGFLTEVRTLLDATPAESQRLLFSATLDEAVDSLVKRYLTDPITHEVDSSQASVTTMVHRPLLVKPHHKNQITAEIANREGKTVLFARTQMGADRIAAQLREAGVMAGSLHGGLTQGARARILAAFREGTVPVLVATDVAARGIHVDDVTLVLQVDPPRDSKDYLHRAGRTARAGQEGVVATIVLPHQRKLGRRLLGQAGVNNVLVEVEPGGEDLIDQTGARRPEGDPIPEAVYLELIAPKKPARRRPEGRRPEGFRGRRRPRRF